MSRKVLELLNWAKKMLTYSSEDRRDFSREVLDSLKSFSYESDTNEPTKEGIALASWLSNRSQFEVVGFIPNVMYIKERAEDPSELKYLWVHPFGSETLLLKHKKLPIMVIANPMIRFNKTVLREMKISKEESQILGISG